MAAASDKRAFEEFMNYCRSLPDYADIEEYLRSDPTPFELKVEGPVFQPGMYAMIIRTIVVSEGAMFVSFFVL
jgi:hypothetical protein